MKIRNKKGIGLLECIVALALIAIVCTSTLTVFLSSNSNTKEQTEQYKIDMMENNVLSCFQYADSVDEFKAALNDTDVETTSNVRDIDVGSSSTDAEYKDYDPSKRMIYQNYDYIMVDNESKTVAFYGGANEICKFNYSSNEAMQKDIALLETYSTGENAIYDKASGYVMNFSFAFNNNETMNVSLMPGNRITWQAGSELYSTTMQPFEQDLYKNKIILGYKGYGYSGYFSSSETTDRMCFYFYDINTGSRPNQFVSNSGNINTDSYTYLAHISFGSNQTSMPLADTTLNADIYLSSADKYSTYSAKSFDNEYTTVSSMFAYIKYQTDKNSNELKTGLQSGYKYYADTIIYTLKSDSNITYARKDTKKDANTNQDVETGFSLYCINDDANAEDTLIYQYTDTTKLAENFNKVTGSGTKLSFTYNDTETKLWYNSYSGSNTTKVKFDFDNCTAVFYDTSSKDVYKFKYQDSSALTEAENSLMGFKDDTAALSSGKYSEYYNFCLSGSKSTAITKNYNTAECNQLIEDYVLTVNNDEITKEYYTSEQQITWTSGSGKKKKTYTSYDVQLKKYKKNKIGGITTTFVNVTAFVKYKFTLTLKSITVDNIKGEVEYKDGKVNYKFTCDYKLNYELTSECIPRIVVNDSNGTAEDAGETISNPSSKGQTNYYGGAANETEARNKISAWFEDKVKNNSQINSTSTLPKDITDYETEYNKYAGYSISRQDNAYKTGENVSIDVAESTIKPYWDTLDVKSAPYITENGTKIENTAYLSSNASTFLRYYLKGSTKGEHYEVIQGNNIIFYAPSTIKFINPDGVKAQWKIDTETVSVTGQICTYRCIYKEGDYACIVKAIFSNVGYQDSNAPKIEILSYKQADVSEIDKSSYADSNAYFDAIEEKLTSNGKTKTTYRKG